jgi:hypothetical protein
MSWNVGRISAAGSELRLRVADPCYGMAVAPMSAFARFADVQSQSQHAGKVPTGDIAD